MSLSTFTSHGWNMLALGLVLDEVWFAFGSTYQIRVLVCGAQLHI